MTYSYFGIDCIKITANVDWFPWDSFILLLSSKWCIRYSGMEYVFWCPMISFLLLWLYYSFHVSFVYLFEYNWNSKLVSCGSKNMLWQFEFIIVSLAVLPALVFLILLLCHWYSFCNHLSWNKSSFDTSVFQ